MKKFFGKLKNKANSLAISAKSTLDNARAEGYIDTGVKIIIGVVVGAVILGGLYALFDGVPRAFCSARESTFALCRCFVGSSLKDSIPACPTVVRNSVSEEH